MVFSCTQAVTLATGQVTQPPSDDPAMYVSDNKGRLDSALEEKRCL